MHFSLCRDNQVNVSTKKLYSYTAQNYQVDARSGARCTFRLVQNKTGCNLSQS